MFTIVIWQCLTKICETETLLFSFKLLGAFNSVQILSRIFTFRNILFSHQIWEGVLELKHKTNVAWRRVNVSDFTTHVNIYSQRQTDCCNDVQPNLSHGFLFHSLIISPSCQQIKRLSWNLCCQGSLQVVRSKLPPLTNRPITAVWTLLCSWVPSGTIYTATY